MDNILRLQKVDNIDDIKEKYLVDQRNVNIIIGKSGGTAHVDSLNYKISIPTKWIKDMGIIPEDRGVKMCYENGTISFTKLPIEVKKQKDTYEVVSRIASASALLELKGYIEAIDIDTGELLTLKNIV